MFESYTSAPSDFSMILDDISAAADSHTGVTKLLYTRKEASWAIGVSCRSLDYLIANKQLSFRKLGKKVMIPAGELARFARMDHQHLTSTPAE